MINRNLIAILLPMSLEFALREEYSAAYTKPCRVRTFHVTLIPPFTLSDPVQTGTIQNIINQLPFPSISFTFGPAGIFTQHRRHILHLPILPVIPLQEYYAKLNQLVSAYLRIDTSAYTDNQLPPFLPHLTLDYHFFGDPAKLKSPDAPFTLPAPELLKETGPGIWKPV